MAFDLGACPTGWSNYAAAGGRTIIGANPNGGNGLSQRDLGDTLGEETHTQVVGEMPPHSHSWGGGNSAGGSPIPFIAQNATAITTVVDTNTQGGGQPFNLMQPSIVLRYCRKD